MNTIFYIVVHNIGLIEFFEKTRKYKHLNNYKYLLVGNHQDNHTSDKVIQCNLLNYNIEYQKNYLAYTGWYAVAKNKELHDRYDYICFLEYDTDVEDFFNFENFQNDLIKKGVKCCGVTYMPTHSGLFEKSQFTKKLISYLVKSGNSEISPNNENWITTNNMFFQKDFLLEYFDDALTRNFLDYMENDIMSGHYLERFLSIYCFIKNVQFSILENSGFTHRGFDSHNTQNIYHSNRGYEKFKLENNIIER